MNTYSQRFQNKIYSIEQKIPVYRGDNWLKIYQKSKYVNGGMSSKSEKAMSWNRSETEIIKITRPRAFK